MRKGWSFNQYQKVWQYGYGANRAEIAGPKGTEKGSRCYGLHAMTVWINGVKHEIGGFDNIIQCMKCCEGKLADYQYLFIMMRIAMLTILGIMCAMQPGLFVLTFMSISYVVVGWMMYSGELNLDMNSLTITSPTQKFFENSVLWLFSPFIFAIMVCFFSVKFPN